jgi:hypothetical protein
LGTATNGIYTQVSNTSNPLQTAYLAVYGGLGLGVNNRETAVEQFGTSPQHAISNEAGYDSVLFDFSTPTTLTSVTLGYPGTSSGCTYNSSSCDSDLVVLEWLGSGVPDLTTTSYASMNTATSGWKLVGSPIANAAANNPNAINGGVASSYWLIGTYIPITGAINPDGTNNKADFAKIASVTGTVAPPGVPEPNSLALAGLSIGTLGLVRRLRRRRQLR